MKIDGAQVRIRSLNHAAVALGANAAILADTAMAVATPTDVAVFAGQPDVPRNLTVKGNDANVTGNVTITGLDAVGNEISEVIALNAANVVQGVKAFAEVTLITLPDYNVANTERVRVGTGAKLGLPVALTRNTVIAAFLANVKEAVAPTVVVDADEIEKNTVTLNSALNGTAVIVDFYETQ
jgi:hypothetical protein